MPPLDIFLGSGDNHPFMEPVFVGIEIGGTKIQVVTGDDRARILERHRFVTDKSLRGEGIREQIARALKKIQSVNVVRAIGVGFGGPFNRETGRTCCSHQVEGWGDFPLRDWLSGQVSGVPVCIDNDANTAALGEARTGAGQGESVVFYITLGSGIGGGLVVDGELYHGALPTEVEIGHVRLNLDGESLESKCSGWASDRRLREYAAANPDSPLAKRLVKREGGEAEYWMDAIEDGDEGARELFTETCRDLAFGLSHVVHLLNPSMIILGGGLSLIGEPLRAGIETALGQAIMKVLLPGPSVRLAKLAEDAVPVGALHLALTAG